MTPIVEARTEPPAPLKFERRRSSRWPVEGSATALHLSPEGFGRINELVLVNVSAGGMLARCAEPVDPGTVLSVGFADPGHLARRGVVQRCVPGGDGYLVAVEFQLGLAA